MPDGLAATEGDLLNTATRLANAPDAAAELRRTLRERMRASKLMDPASFARCVEDAYQQMRDQMTQDTREPASDPAADPNREHTTWLQDTYERAKQIHRGGDISGACALYDQILAQVPEHPGAMHYLGLAEVQQNQPAGLARMRAACALQPGNEDFLDNVRKAEVLLRQRGIPLGDQPAETQRQNTQPDAKRPNSPWTLTIAEDVRIHVPADLRCMTTYVLLEQEDWFEAERAFVCRLVQSGWAMIDAGACFGVYALSLAKRLQALGQGGQVLAIEPAAGPARLLEQSITANQLGDRLSLRRLALAARPGPVRLSRPATIELSKLLDPAPLPERRAANRADTTEPGSALGDADEQSVAAAAATAAVGQAETNTSTATATTLDALLEDPIWSGPETRIDLLKLDLCGGEDQALAGAERLLREHDPLILFNVGRAKTADSPLRQRLARHGYQCYRLIPGLDALAPLDPARPLDAFDINLFACKPGRAAQLRDLGRLLEKPLGTCELAAPAGGPVAAPPATAFEPRALSPAASSAAPPPPRHWSEALATYPYVSAVTRSGQTLRGWAEVERGADPHWPDYEYALNAYLSASDPTQPLPERAAWLAQSLRLLQHLRDNGDDDPLTRALHLRALVAAGERLQATRLAQRLAALESTGSAPRFDRPFLPPWSEYDQRVPVNGVKGWFTAAIRESVEGLACLSGFFDTATDHTRNRSQPLLDNPNCGMVMRRRAALMDLRRGENLRERWQPPELKLSAPNADAWSKAFGDLASPLPTTLAKRLEILTTQREPRTIRLLHQMARSGGTIMGRCLGCMDNIWLLSEVHPRAERLRLGGHPIFSALRQAHDWHQVFSAEEASQLARAKVPYPDLIRLIDEEARLSGRTLVLRDWSHLDFTGVPFAHDVPYRSLHAELLAQNFRIAQFATVRHPVDQWLSLKRLPIISGKLSLEAFLAGYRHFAEFARDVGFVRYEDFVRDPTETMRAVCEALDLPFDSAFLSKWQKYDKITGDTSAAKRDNNTNIKRRARAPISSNELAAFERNPDYHLSLELLGYTTSDVMNTKSSDATTAKSGASASDEPASATGKADASQAIAAFVAENTKRWAQIQPQRTDQCILVELLVGHPAYFMANAVLAKYLQQFHGCAIKAILPKRDDKYSHALAISYGIRDFYYEEELKDYITDADREWVKGYLSACGGAELRQILLEMRLNNIPVGDLVYDMYLRNTGNVTVDQLDSNLLNTAISAMAYYRLYDKILSENDVVATAVGHTVYTRFGVLARVSVAHGAAVYGKKPNPVRVRRYDSLQEFPGHEGALLNAPFEYIWGKHRSQALSLGRDRIAKQFSSNGSSFSEDRKGRWYSEGYSENQRIYSRNELCDAVGFDVDKPIVVIFSHCMTDAPNSHARHLFDDLYQFLIQTLKYVAGEASTNWLVKPHPDDKFYQSKVSAEQVYSQFSEHAHIGLCPADLNNRSFFDWAQAVVTVHGTAGMEMPSQGIPAILAGESNYSGNGFTYEPATPEEYFRLLSTARALPRLSQQEVERAIVTIGGLHDFAGVDCRYIPTMPTTPWERYDTAQVFREAAHRAKSTDYAEDPFFRALAQQVAMGSKQLFNYEILTVTDR